MWRFFTLFFVCWFIGLKPSLRIYDVNRKAAFINWSFNSPNVSFFATRVFHLNTETWNQPRLGGTGLVGESGASNLHYEVTLLWEHLWSPSSHCHPSTCKEWWEEDRRIFKLRPGLLSCCNWTHGMSPLSRDHLDMCVCVPTADGLPPLSLNAVLSQVGAKKPALWKKDKRCSTEVRRDTHWCAR